MRTKFLLCRTAVLLVVIFITKDIFAREPISLGTITGPFANVQLSPTLGNLTYNLNTVAVQKVSLTILAVSWGNFTAVGTDGRAMLQWNTLQESNTSHFIVEHSSDGTTFTSLAVINAAGHANSTSVYTYTDLKAGLCPVNYYRLKLVNKNSRASYSKIRVVRFNTTSITATPNPVKDNLQVNVYTKEVEIVVSDAAGRKILQAAMRTGIHRVDTEKWLPGIYQLSVIEQGRIIETKKILKL